jgi:hypothetical protein
MLTALKPLYKVELVKKGRSRYYQATAHNGSWSYKFPGTTSITDIVGGQKTRALMSWAVRVGMEALSDELSKYGSDMVLLEPERIEAWKALVKGAYTKKKDAAADRGTLYHSYLETWGKGLPLPEDAPSEFLEALESLKTKLHQDGVDLIGAEVPVASLDYQVGGLVDATAIRMGDYGIIDWKFASFMSPDYALQVGGSYARAATETFGVPFKWARIYRYDLASKFWDAQTIMNTDLALEGFLAAKKLKEIIEGDLYCE